MYFMRPSKERDMYYFIHTFKMHDRNTEKVKCSNGEIKVKWMIRYLFFYMDSVAVKNVQN